MRSRTVLFIFLVLSFFSCTVFAADDYSTTTENTSTRIESVSRASNTATRVGNTVKIHRFYNIETAEHLFTGSSAEIAALNNNVSWFDEGVAWYAPNAGDPVYRLHQIGTSKHLYTTDRGEFDSLIRRGDWRADFSGTAAFYSGGDVPVYRNYQRSTGSHQLTTDSHEYNTLAGRGWKQEGVALRAVKISEVPLVPVPSYRQITVTPTTSQTRVVTNQYVLNTNTHVFHYPNCSWVGRMSEKNKRIFNGTREEAMNLGYSPCEFCDP